MVWNETDKIVASDRQSNARFGGLGNGSKIVSIHGDYAVVGAEKNDHSGLIDAGAAYIYKKNASGGWDFEQKIVASNPQAYALFGSSVAISEYNDFIVVGSPDYNSPSITPNGLTQSGTAYLFKRNLAGIWAQVQQLYPTYLDRESYARFGNSVDITTRRVIVGAFRESHDPNLPSSSQSGAAYIFERNGGTDSWDLIQKLTASDRGVVNQFGTGVAISFNYVIVGAPKNSLDVNGNNPITGSGSAYIFEKIGPAPWTEVNKITSTDRNLEERYGTSVDIDDRFIIVGAPGDDLDAQGNNLINKAGSAFIYNRSSFSATWGLQSKIVAGDRQGNDFFGLSVGIDKIGFAVVGTYFEDHDANGNNFLDRAGSAYVFEYNTSSLPLWSQDQKIVASDRSTFDEFGAGVSIDEKNIIVSARSEDHDENGGNFISNAGSAYLYKLETIPTPGASKTAISTDIEAAFGNSQFIAIPNPSTGLARLSVPNFKENQNYTLVIYDFTGRKVVEDIITSQNYQVDLGGQENGIYLVHLSDGTSIHQLKLLISK